MKTNSATASAAISRAASGVSRFLPPSPWPQRAARAQGQGDARPRLQRGRARPAHALARGRRGQGRARRGQDPLHAGGRPARAAGSGGRPLPEGLRRLLRPRGGGDHRRRQAGALSRRARPCSTGATRWSSPRPTGRPSPRPCAWRGRRPSSCHAREKDGFRSPPAMIARALSPRTKAVVLNTPSQPHGGDRRARGAAGDRRAWPVAASFTILYDDTYARLVFGARSSPCFRPLRDAVGRPLRGPGHRFQDATA